MTETLSGNGLRKKYGDREVVKGVSLSVNRGQVVGLLGPNGAGKTTTFYMMVGLVQSDGGDIQLNQDDITSLALHQRAKMGIGYLPQEASVFRELSVEENIYCVSEVRGLSRSQRLNLTTSLIQEFGLGHIKKSKGRELSGGERRRVEIARALALEPKFVLLDEPFAGVDPLAVNDIQQIVTELKKKNIGILITDHNVRETLGIVDHAYIMNAGEVLVEGDPKEVVDNEIARKFYLGEEFSM